MKRYTIQNMFSPPGVIDRQTGRRQIACAEIGQVDTLTEIKPYLTGLDIVVIDNSEGRNLTEEELANLPD